MIPRWHVPFACANENSRLFGWQLRKVPSLVIDRVWSRDEGNCPRVVFGADTLINFRGFMKIVAEADGCIATTPEAAEIYQRIRSKHDPGTVAFIPTPYPFDDQRWNFSQLPTEQSNR